MIPGPERPMKRLAPSITSRGEPSRRAGLVCSASQRLGSFIEPAS